jgi:hypothetical protein
MGLRYLSEHEIAAAFTLSESNAPIGYAGVSQTQLSIARHYGGLTVNGRRYTYFPDLDELVRDDVLKMAHDMRKQAKRDAETQAKARQGSLL